MRVFFAVCWVVLLLVGGWLYYFDTVLAMWLAPPAAGLAISVQLESRSQPVHLASAFVAASSLFLTPVFC